MDSVEAAGRQRSQAEAAMCNNIYFVSTTFYAEREPSSRRF